MLVREFLDKNKPIIMPQPSYSPDLAHADFFFKTEDNDERKAVCCDWGDKRKFEIVAIGDTKERVSEVFRALEKMRRLLLNGQDSY